MSKKDNRILCIVGRMDAGGAETFLMKIFREINKYGYIMDFCVSKEGEGFYDKEIKEMGGEISKVVSKTSNPIASFLSIFNIVKKGNYKRVMRISQHSLSTIELLASKLAGAKILVFRSSNTKTINSGFESKLHHFFKFLPKTIPNVKIAPSTEAANFMFGKNTDALIIKNAINSADFLFDEEKRKKIRKELDIENKFVLGNIGRLENQKNQKFLINIFALVKKKIPNSKLLIVGEGTLEKELKEQILKLELEEDILFLGVRNDISLILMAMDLFVFPSLYEGLPNTVIEAQATGLNCLISNTITPEVKITDLVKFLPLDNMEVWLEEVITFKNKFDKDLNNDRNTQNQIVNSGYDISSSAQYFIDAVFHDRI